MNRSLSPTRFLSTSTRASTSSVRQGSRSAGSPVRAQRRGDLGLERRRRASRARPRRGTRRSGRGRPPRRGGAPVARLDRVADGVAEVEQRAVAGALALVAADDRGLVGDRALRSRRAARAARGAPSAGGPARRSASTRCHSSRPSSSAYFHSSPNPARRSRAGSVASVARPHATSRGCQNAPTRFLPAGEIDRGLAADRGVGHRDERRRQLDDRDAAEQRRRDEAGEIADDAAAERDDRRAAIEAARDQLVAQPLVGRERLARLAGLDRR